MKTAFRQCVLVGSWVYILITGGSAFGLDMEYRSITLGLRPYLDASVSYDSNVKLSTQDKESDVFLQAQAGLDLNLLYKWLRLDAVGYSYSRTYSGTGNDEQEKLSRGEQVDLAFGNRDKVRVGISESYEHATDYSLLTQPISAETAQPGQTQLNQTDWSERTARDLWRLGIMLGRDLTDKTEGDIGYTYTENDYVRPELNDLERNEGQLRLGYKVTDKSVLFLDGRYAIEDSQGYEDTGSDLYIGPGWKTHMTEKVDFMGSAGYESYRSGTLKGRNDQSDVDSIGVHLNGTWRPVDKLSFGLSGDRGVEASPIDANTRDVTLFELTTGYRLKEDLSTSLILSYRVDEYDKPPPEGTEARRLDSEGASLGVNYNVLRCLVVYASATYEITHSNLPDEDYDQFRATLGARASF